MRWPSDWRDPALLNLVQNTPINCLVLDWTPESRQALGPVIQAGRSAGLALVANIPPKADTKAATAEAEAAGVMAVAAEQAPQTKLVSFAWCEKEKLPWTAPGSLLATGEGVWPGVQTGQGGSAGPTGLPWIDSNGWWIQLARARAPKTPLWVGYDPPADQSFIRPQNYALAVADAYAYGARWPVSLDKNLKPALAERRQAALDAWKTLTDAISFFLRHPEWGALEPQATMGVISSFSGEDEYLGGEILNLLARRGVPYRIMIRDRAAKASLAGLRGIVYADPAPPDPVLGKRLIDFVQSGGTLIANAKWPHKNGKPAGVDMYKRYDLFALGKGRLAVAKDENPDPYLMAGDAQLLASNRYLPVKFFNSGTLTFFYAGSPDGKRAVLHLINYAMRQFGHPVSVALTKPYRTARIRSLASDEAKPLETSPANNGGVELHLPVFGLYAAIELEA